MRYDKTYWRMVGIALLPAVGASVIVALAGRLFGVSDTVVDRISQVLFFPTFLAACHNFRARSHAST